MLAALAHDFGKPATTEFIDGRLRSRGHEEAGVPPTESFLDRVNVHTIDGYNVRGQVIALVREHLKPGEFYKKRDEVGEGAFRRLARADVFIPHDLSPDAVRDDVRQAVAVPIRHAENRVTPLRLRRPLDRAVRPRLVADHLAVGFE